MGYLSRLKKSMWCYGNKISRIFEKSGDAVVIKKYVAGFTGFTIDLDAADVNADGKVDTRDAVKILKKIAGFDVTLGEA